MRLPDAVTEATLETDADGVPEGDRDGGENVREGERRLLMEAEDEALGVQLWVLVGASVTVWVGVGLHVWEAEGGDGVGVAEGGDALGERDGGEPEKEAVWSCERVAVPDGVGLNVNGAETDSDRVTEGLRLRDDVWLWVRVGA